MITSLPHRRFILVPMLLLAAFLGLFSAVEYRKHINDSEIRRIVNAPLSEQVSLIQQAVDSLESLVDLHFSPGSSEPDSTALYASYETLVQREVVLRGLLLDEALNAHENVDQMDKLDAVLLEVKHIGKLLPADGRRLSFEEWKNLREHVETLILRARAFRGSVESAHKEEANVLLTEIASYEKQRGFLAALILLSGLAMILVLLDNMHRFRRSAMRSLKAEHYNAIFASALQSTRVGVLIRDMQTPGLPVVFVNSAFTKMTGYVMGDVNGSSSAFLFGWKTDPATVAVYHRALSLRETATFELLIYRKDGSPFWSEWHLSPVFDEDGVVSHFISLFTDTSKLRETQEDLIQAKQLAQHASAVKTSFLAMMSHEIRTPINGILGVLKLVEETALDNEQRHLIGIARTSSNALHGIINDILDYAKMEAGKTELYEETFSLANLLDNTVGLFQTIASEKGVELQLDLQPDLPPSFFGDEGRIRQVILNLVSNAIKFTDHGFVRLRVFSLMSQDVHGKPGLLLRFEVQDTGIGISSEDQAKLFQEFSQIERSFTRRFGGTGLGLAISRRLVDLMHGEIGVESQSAKGSRFWFMIPVQIASAEQQSEEPSVESEPASSFEANRLYHILLVEDNDTNRLVARRYLEKAGFLVEEAVNGVDAIEKAKAIAFDLILMDVSMPEMDGMLATCHIRALGGANARIPVVALTAHVMAGDRELCLAAGMNDYLHKPLDYDALMKTMQRWLHMKPEQRPELPQTACAMPEKPMTQMSAQTEAQPDLDPRVLAQMAETLGHETVAEVTRVFLSDSLDRLTAFEGASRETIRDTAHTLKSCSGNCGLNRFSALMAALEKAAAQGDMAVMAALMPQIQETYALGRARLEEERVKYTT